MTDTLTTHDNAPAGFGNAKDIRISRICAETRPYLVMIRAGSQPRPLFFATPIPKDRTFDVALSYYAPPHLDDIGFSTADIVFTGGSSKFHAAKLFLKSTAYHERYGGVLFLDDDVQLLFDVDDFFKFCESNELHLAQASLSNASNSFANWGITENHPGLVMRTTNFVEVMAPFFAREFLKKMLHSFDMSISGWGIDIYWGYHLGSNWKAAIIDQFTMKHEKPASTGPFYDYLKSIGVDPREELRKIFDAIGLNSYQIRPIQFIYRIYQQMRPE